MNNIIDLKNKYIIRKTEEEVQIVSFNISEDGKRDKEDWVSYIDSNDVEHYKEPLNLQFDFRPIDEYSKALLKLMKEFEESKKEYKPLDLSSLPPLPSPEESLRNQAAITAMQGVMNFFGSIDYNRDTIAKLAVEQADALIEELKKK